MYVCMWAGFLCHKCDNFACLHTGQDKNELHVKRWFFFVPKSTSSVSRSQAHSICKSWTNWTMYGVIPRYLCKIHLNDVSEMFNCWERRWIDVDGASHTLSAKAAIFSAFWLFTLWFTDEDASFFHFFHKITNIRSWQCFSSSKVMSQYFPALIKPIHNHIRSAEG